MRSLLDGHREMTDEDLLSVNLRLAFNVRSLCFPSFFIFSFCFFSFSALELSHHYSLVEQ